MMVACAPPAGDGARQQASRIGSGAPQVASFDPQAPARLASAWADWKASWVTTSGAGGGARVLFQDGSQKPGDVTESTVSEAIGYGMLLAVYFDEQPLFDALNAYFQKHTNAHGLMGWKVLADGSFDASVGGSSSATDADEDMAAALVLASARWSSDAYRTQAVDLIGKILTYDVDSTGGRDQPNPTYSIMGGDWQTSAPIDFNPSYFAPAWYRLFEQVTGDARWSQVIEEGYAVLALAADPTTGLVPQDRRVDGTSFNGQDEYEYNAFRAPFRLATDQAWFGEARARDHVARIASFYAGVINPDHTQLYAPGVYATRQLDGTVLGQYEAGGFSSTATVALLASGNTVDGRYLYDTLWTEPGRADDMRQYYYDGAWHLFGALFASGNFPNFAAAAAGGTGGTGTGADSGASDPDSASGSPSPSPSPAPPPSFTVSATASPNPIEAGQPTTITFQVESDGASYPAALVDIELRDANQNAVAQTWFTPEVLADGQMRTFTWSVRAPGGIGAYAIDVGVFATDWSKNYVYRQAGTLDVARGP